MNKTIEKEKNEEVQQEDQINQKEIGLQQGTSKEDSTIINRPLTMPIKRNVGANLGTIERTEDRATGGNTIASVANKILPSASTIKAISSFGMFASLAAGIALTVLSGPFPFLLPAIPVLWSIFSVTCAITAVSMINPLFNAGAGLISFGVNVVSKTAHKILDIGKSIRRVFVSKKESGKPIAKQACIQNSIKTDNQKEESETNIKNKRNIGQEQIITEHKNSQITQGEMTGGKDIEPAKKTNQENRQEKHNVKLNVTKTNIAKMTERENTAKQSTASRLF